MNLFLFVLGVVLFFGLVVVHEFGHFIMARRGGVGVEEFGIGFPPRLFKKKTKGGWLFTLNLLPLGGFVKLKGEHDTDTTPGSLGAASVGTKSKIMAAGVVMNLITAYVLLVALAWVGMPQVVADQFTVKSDAAYVSRAETYIAAGSVEAGSPAAKTGVKQDDKLLAFGPAGHLVPLSNEDTLPKLTQQYAGQTVMFQYQPASQSASVTREVTLRSAAEVAQAKQAGKPAGYLGVSEYQAQKGMTVIRSTWSAPIVAAGVIKQVTVLTLQGLGKALQGLGGIIGGFVTHDAAARVAAQNEASSQVAGPVGIFFVFKYGSELGLSFILFIVAILSLTLAIMNILPIPALDGGRLWLMLISRAVRRPLKPELEEAIHGAGFAFLMCLLILITIVDVRRFIY